MAAEGVHLPEAVLCGDEALGEEEVVERGGAEVGDAVGVALDGDGSGEAGDGEPADGPGAEQVVEPGVLPDRREDAGGHRDQDAEEHGEEGELEAHREAPQDLVEHRLLGPERHAQVSLHRVAEVGEVLAIEGPVEAHHLLELRLVAGVALLAHHEGHDVAGQQPDDGEDEQGDEEQRRQQQHQPAEHVAGHQGAGDQAFLPSSQISS